MVKSAVRIWIGLDHFATNTSSTTQPHKIKYQQTTCAMQFSPCLKSRTSKAPQSIKCDYCVVSFAVPYSYNSCVVFLQIEYADITCLEVWYSALSGSKCCLQQLNQPNVIISHSCNTCGHFLQLEYR